MPISVTIGHATDEINRTGCTVIRFSEPAPCVVDVRGGAPGTRETDLLAPGKRVQRVDALVLSGGSAFGLATADGVMRRLKEEGRGFPTVAGPVPIVPTAVIYDLAIGNPVPPAPEMGYEAATSLDSIRDADWGAIGAGTGATFDKLVGNPQRGGIGSATIAYEGGSITAIAVVNAVGAIGADFTSVERRERQQALLHPSTHARTGENTTLVVVLVDGNVDHDGLHQVAVSAHDGMARAIVPCHTPFDGDLVFAATLRPDTSHTPISLQ
ncbi:MAG: P1 family peptidase, partial [Thermomicrobiales bacterium]